MSATTHTEDPSSAVLFMAFELASSSWRLGFTIGLGQRPRERTVAAGDLEAIQGEIARAKRRFSLADNARVFSCYEAGRDGFWLHRFLVSHGIDNHIVDSSSIEVNRRARRAKTDHLDVDKLLQMLIRYHAGDRRVWSVIRVPTSAEDDRRQLHRELSTTKRDRARCTNRIKGLLVCQGLSLVSLRNLRSQLDCLALWDGSALPTALRGRLLREWDKAEMLSRHIRELETQRRELLRTSDEAAIAQVRQLIGLRSLGTNSAWMFVMEFFGWRQFRNRKQVGALAGLAPTPHQSGDSSREQGIAKAGNRHLRAMVIEIAWLWLRHQPQSALAQWYQERFGHGSSRMRKVGIVALARKLLIALWQFLETGVLPEGALLKTQIRY